MGDNLKVVWSDFSSISLGVLLNCTVSAQITIQPLLELKTWPSYLKLAELLFFSTITQENK
jgi:hypothetical protein